MATGEEERLKLLNSLIKVHGEDAARKLMESLPPFPWDEIATKDDLKALKEWAETRFDRIDAQFESVNAQFESVNARFEGVDAQFEGVDAQFEGVKAQFESVNGRFTQLEGSLSLQIAEQTKKMAEQTRTLAALFSGFALSICGAIAGGVFFV